MLKSSQKDFIKRHIGPSEVEQSFMLKELGFKNLDELIKKLFLKKYYLKKILRLESHTLSMKP